MRKTELIVSGEVICPKTKASIVAHEHTNVETLLDQQNRTSSTITQSSAMSQVGVGDDMDLSFCVEDGFYESATLYGKTMVNCIQEPSSKDVVLPYAFENGQHVTIKDTKESGALGVELKGQTLVNIHKSTTYSLSRKNEGWYENLVAETNRISFEVTDTSIDGWKYLNLGKLNLDMLKPNTKYLVYFGVANFPHNLGVRFMNGNATDKISNEAMVAQGSNWAILTTSSEIIKSEQVLYVSFTNVLGKVEVGNAMIIEYQQGMENWDISYFEGMASCKMPTLHTVGKNLWHGEMEIGGLSLNNGGDDNSLKDRVRLKGYIKVKPNTSYMISRPSVEGDWAVRFYDENYNHVAPHVYNKLTTLSFTTGVNIHYIRMVEITSQLNKEYQLELGSQVTAYEPHKSSILSLPEEVVLRSLPNGVRDTFNTRTGVYTQRIGEIVLDGTESDWGRYHGNGGLYYFRKPLPSMIEFNNQPSTPDMILGDRVCFNKYDYLYQSTSISETLMGATTLSNALKVQCVYIYYNNVDDIDVFKQYLQSNPITVQYQLETPIVTKINLSSTLKSWNTTTHIYSEIPENTLYPILSHSNPTYPVILKPSTRYSIVANSYSNNHTNSTVNFNLGGATASATVGNRVTTITTPSTLTSEELVMSGRGNKLNNVMVIEGDVVGDEPHFEGICDCQSPILSNVGKNLFNGESRVGYYTTETGIYNPTPSITQCCNITPIQVSGGTKYSFLLPEGDMKNGRTFLYDSKMNFITSIINADVRYVITTTQNTKYINFHFDNTTPELFSKVQLEESSSATSYEPYKSNILSCNGDKIELTEDMFEQGGYDGGASLTYEETKSNNTKRLRTKTYIRVKPNTTYRITSSLFKFNHREYESSGFTNGVKSEWTNELLFTTQTTTQYITLLLKDTNNDNKVLTADLFNDDDVVIREVDKTIVLRSLPNGVCDTLNVETGEYVQNIMEFTVGKEDSKWYAITEYDKTLSAQIDVSSELRNMFYKNASPIVCDKFPWLSASQDTEHVRFSTPADVAYSNTIIVWINKTKLSSYTANGINDYIKSVGGITVQGRLLSPIVKTVDLEGYPFAYKDGHIVLSSGSIEASLTPKIEYVVQTNRAGAIQANQDRLINHDKRLAMLEDLVLHQLIQLEYNRAKCTFLSQTRQIFEGGIQMYHTKYELLSEFIEKKLYHSLEEVFEMLDVYFMLGDITDGEYDALYEALMPSAEEIFEVEETFDHEDVEV